MHAQDGRRDCYIHYGVVNSRIAVNAILDGVIHLGRCQAITNYLLRHSEVRETTSELYSEVAKCDDLPGFPKVSFR
jgi:hypothetical protein